MSGSVNMTATMCQSLLTAAVKVARQQQSCSATAALVFAGLALEILASSPALASPGNTANVSARVSYTNQATGFSRMPGTAQQTNVPGRFISADAFASDGFDMDNNFLGSATANATAVAGDRYVKAFTSVSQVSSFADNNLDALPATYAYASGTWTSIVNPSSSGFASANGFFQRKNSFTDPLPYEFREFDVKFSLLSNFQTIIGTLDVQLSSSSYFEIKVEQLGTGNSSRVFWTDSVERSIQGFTDFDGSINLSGTQYADSRAFRENIVNGFSDSEEISFPGADEVGLEGLEGFFGSVLGYGRADLVGMPLFFDSNHEYRLTVSLGCASYIRFPSGTATFAPQVATGCDAGNSGYWAGLSDFTDADGNAIAPFGLVEASSGLDISGPSPFLPTVTAVPEPANWALLIAGFGLVGAAQRRRRTPQLG